MLLSGANGNAPLRGEWQRLPRAAWRVDTDRSCRCPDGGRGFRPRWGSRGRCARPPLWAGTTQFGAAAQRLAPLARAAGGSAWIAVFLLVLASISLACTSEHARPPAAPTPPAMTASSTPAAHEAPPTASAPCPESPPTFSPVPTGVPLPLRALCAHDDGALARLLPRATATPVPGLADLDARIDSIREHSKTDANWVTLVTYSVLPGPGAREHWLIGNGAPGRDDWIEGKTVFLFLRSDSPHVYLDQVTTSPPPPLPASTAAPQ